jgi:hypothetical protein
MLCHLRAVVLADGRSGDDGFDKSKFLSSAVESATGQSSIPIMLEPPRTMQYMLLIYLDDAKFEPLSERERARHGNAMLDYDEELQASGHYVISEPLQPTTAAVTVRKWDGALTATDGPFMETKEYLSGFFIVEARDLNEAIDLAARMPLATMGSIEVRPLGTLKRQPL